MKLYIIKGLIDFPVAMFYKETLVRILPVTFITFIIVLIPFEVMDSSITRLLITVVFSAVTLGGSIYLIGLEKSERTLVNNKLLSIWNKISNK